MVCDRRPLKNEKHRVRISAGGDRIPYHQDAGSPAADLVETKLINNVTSDTRKGARLMPLDVKDNFPATPIIDPEHMRVKYENVPTNIKARDKID